MGSLYELSVLVRFANRGVRRAWRAAPSGVDNGCNTAIGLRCVVENTIYVSVTNGSGLSDHKDRENGRRKIS